MKTVSKPIAIAILALACALPAFAQSEEATITDRRTASDGITTGWILEYPWPDPTDTSQSWRTLPATLVLARRGHVVRRIHANSVFWSWSFWHGGAEVAYQQGALHGATECLLVNVASGHILKRSRGDCSDVSASSPAWVKAATGNKESH